jgi:hypothetical protein
MYDALCHDGGMMGYAALLVSGIMLGVDEATENSKGERKKKKKVCVLSKPFKVRNTGVRETHETLW